MSDLTSSFASELASLRRLVQLSSGSPAFAFALCNQPAIRREIISQVTGPDVALAELPEDAEDPVATARAQIPVEHRGAVFVTGLDKLLSESHPDSSGQIARLNRSRERWRSRFPAQLLVFWVTEQALLRILREAPDFRAWVSHELDFVEPLSLPSTLERQAAPVSAESTARASSILERLRHPEELPPMQRLSLIRELLRLAPVSSETATWVESGIQESLHNLRQRANTGDSHAQRDLELALDDVAASYQELGHSQAARRHYEESHAIAERLAASDPANAAWQRDLSVSLNKLGDLAVAQGDLAGALRSFTESKAIAERLAASAPANAEWQRDLWVSYWKLADHSEKSGQALAAKEWWQKAHDTLASMKARGLHVSPRDEGILDRLKMKVVD
jgi:tetratricopeptide (TPR) repeat protein